MYNCQNWAKMKALKFQNSYEPFTDLCQFTPKCGKHNSQAGLLASGN